MGAIAAALRAARVPLVRAGKFLLAHKGSVVNLALAGGALSEVVEDAITTASTSVNESEAGWQKVDTTWDAVMRGGQAVPEGSPEAMQMNALIDAARAEGYPVDQMVMVVLGVNGASGSVGVPLPANFVPSFIAERVGVSAPTIAGAPYDPVYRQPPAAGPSGDAAARQRVLKAMKRVSNALGIIPRDVPEFLEDLKLLAGTPPELMALLNDVMDQVA